MNKKIKVLHTEWSDGWGGQEIRIINEMLAVREKGVEVFLACREDSKIKQHAIKKNIKVFTLPFKGSIDMSTIISLVKIIKKYHIDIINSHSGKDSWVAGFAAKIAGIKFIRTRHLSNPINPSRFNFVNEMADFIFTTGEKVKDAMIKNNRISPDKILSIPTGIDEKIFDPKNCNFKELRKHYNIEENDIAIGIIAVIRGFKRHDLFLKAAKILSDRYSNLKFFIAGDGPRKKDMQKLSNDLKLKNTIFLGHINNPQDLLCALDIFVLSSDSNEGVPQSVMQALMMNKKVVATDAGSTKDLFYDNNFYIAKTNSIEDIVKGIEYQLQNTDAKETREFMVKNFSKSVMRDKIIEIYKELLNEKQNTLS